MNVCLQNNDFCFLFRCCVRLLSALLIDGRYFDGSCDMCLHFIFVANRKHKSSATCPCKQIAIIILNVIAKWQ